MVVVVIDGDWGWNPDSVKRRKEKKSGVSACLPYPPLAEQRPPGPSGQKHTGLLMGLVCLNIVRRIAELGKDR